MKEKTSSLKNRLLLILSLWVFAILAIMVFDMFYSGNRLKNETAREYRNILEMQMRSVDSALGNTAASLVSYKMYGTGVSEFLRAETRSDAVFTIGKIEQDFTKQILPVTDAEFMFVVKDCEDGRASGLSLSSTSSFGTSEKTAIEQYVRNIDISHFTEAYSWQPVMIGNDWYVTYYFTGTDYILGEAIRVLSILNKFGMIQNGTSVLTVRNNTGESMIDIQSAGFTNVPFPKQKEEKNDTQINGDLMLLSNWSISLKRPVYYLRKGIQSRNQKNILIMLETTAILALSVSIILFFLVLNTVHYPVTKLQRAIEMIRDGDLETRVEADSKVPREFSGVYSTLNEMTAQIKDLKIAGYEAELAKRQYEIQYLTIQTEPHFYLNSMKYIYALAEMKKTETLKAVTLHLSGYFRYLTYQCGELVPLSSEVSHIDNYLAVLNAGSENQVAADLDIEEAAYDVKIPKLLLQTFVENSVKYGPKSSSLPLLISICIRVFGEDNEKMLRISVQDNGKGFDEQYLDEIRDKGFTDSEGHIGLSNLYHRLNLLYNEDKIYMKIGNNGEGALCEVMIPVMISEKEKLS